MDERNDTAVPQEGEAKQCSVFFVTYYWTLPAAGVHLYTNVLLIAVSSLVALFGSIANSLVVSSYCWNPRLRTLSNAPLLSLAFGDLLVTAVVLPLHVTRFVQEIRGTHDCTLWTVIRLASYFSVGVSLLSVTIISVERFITLAYPYRFQTILTRARMNTAVAAVWLTTFVVIVSNLGLIPYKVIQAMGTLVVVLCTSTLLLIWSWLYKLLRNHERRIASDHRPSWTPKPEAASGQEAAKRNTQTSGVIVTALVLSYIPLVLMLVYYWTEPMSFTGIYLVTPWGETVVLAHSLFNPLYVFWRKSEFRLTARSFVRRLKCHARRTSGNGDNVSNVT